MEVAVWLTVTCMTIVLTFREWLLATVLVELDSATSWRGGEHLAQAELTKSFPWNWAKEILV